MRETAPARPLTAEIDGRLVPLRPKETLLDAALRAGIDFPHGCRVGGCGTCRCRVVEGEVHERTESAYLLGADELAQGVVLACQSVPRTDVRLEVDLTQRRGLRRVEGRVVGQERLTHDLTRLALQLDAPLDYRPGQFGELSLEGLPGVCRSYSFATPPRPDGRVEFFVRHVPGGRLSSFVHEQQLVGRRAEVAGPAGDFWLRPGTSPLVFVAGGSGLAPILAVLQQAADDGDPRDVTLLFGARRRSDLYAQAELHELARRWTGRFRVVAVLSEEEDAHGAGTADAAGSPPHEAPPWPVERGLVTAHLSAHLPPGAHAYLCGPPAMVDAGLEVLRARGVPREHVHFDRFTTRAELAQAARPAAESAPPEAADAPDAGPLDYLKFFLFHGVGLVSLASLLAGGAAIPAGLVGVVAVYVLGDLLCGDDLTTPRFTRPWILTGALWLALPLLAAIVGAAVWTVCDGDPLGFGAWLSDRLSYDLLAARAATTFGQHVAGVVLTGLMIGMVGTIPAHELTHRTWDPMSMFIGRWLLSASFDTSFAIEHVYGHHRYVATREDPATAPRGRSVFAHVAISTIRGNVSAFRIEAARLRKRGRGVVSVHNAFLRGHAMSLGLVAGAYAMGGLVAAAYFTACALWGKALLEIVNYMEHYGLVRSPATPVQPRHSWNTNRRVSSWSLFRLTRHSHHHAQGEVPYHELRPYPDAPLMITGYLGTILLTLLPPLWHRLMAPRLAAWDRDFATAEERALAAAANARSGLAGLATPSVTAGEAPLRG